MGIMKVGVIGLGAMGSGLAESLLRAGHQVVVWNRSKPPLEPLRAKGARAADIPADAFAGDAVVTMLANDEAVREVVLDGDLLRHAKGGTVHVMSATISVALAKELEEVHAKERVALVCAPVLGRPDVAVRGELNVLAAGAPVARARVRPVLEAIGRKTWILGDQPHKANVAKLSANYMIAATIELLAEVFAFTEKSGLDPKIFFEMATNTLFAAPVFKTYGRLILERDFEPAKFKLKLGLKDVLLALAAGEAAEVPLPFASVLRDNFVDAIAHGAADKDWAAMSQVSFRRAGLKG
jgi:3-hydroxyisobutyrate dehydrogenase-like beta-hydroxyacid dehydrogenase